MSHFTRVQTQISDLDCLLEALADLGYDDVEVGDDIRLLGYRGDDRSKLPIDNPNYAPPCQVAVRRKYIGSAANDLGFVRSDDGTYECLISEYDTQQHPHLVEQLTQRYAYHVVVKNAKWKGYSIEEEIVEEDGSIKLTMTKW
jgi:hypothetical protein